jgi:pimeloyl-ACP methyl ester carboxylesterase
MREGHVHCHSPAGFHRMAYTEWGDAENPRVVICAHGLALNARSLDVLAASLQGHYRVICPDFVGRGKSDRLVDKTSYGYPQYLADMTVLIARSGAERVDWVGISMGGWAGMIIASRPKSPIRKLVISDVASLIPKTGLQRLLKSFTKNDQSFDSFDDFKAYLRNGPGAPFGLKTEQQWDQLAKSVAKFEADGRVRGNYDPAIVEALRSAPAVDVDLEPIWQGVSCPVLIMRGADSDFFLPETYEAMLKKPKVIGVEFPGVGHAPMLMDEEQGRTVREFLLTDT